VGRSESQSLAKLQVHEESLPAMPVPLFSGVQNKNNITRVPLATGNIRRHLGLDGVLACSTAQRAKEIGIRIALGSSRPGVTRLVVADVLRLAGIGMVVGFPAPCCWTGCCGFSSLEFSAANPCTLGGFVLLIALVALLAALLSARRARRASTVDRTTTLPAS
jgi:hypothetical protein